MPKPSRVQTTLTNVQTARANHAERHRATGFQFALADDIDLLNPAAWDSVVGDSCYFLDRSYLRVLRDAGPEQIASKLCLISDAGRPAAVVAAQLLTLDGGRLVANESTHEVPLKGVKARAKALLSRVGRSAVKRVRRRVLVCGNLMSWGNHGVAFAPGVDEAQLWPAVAEALYRIRNAEKLSGKTDYLLVKDHPSQAGLPVEALRRFSYRPVETDPDMVLEIQPQWKSFADYTNSLTSKYRSNVRKIESEITLAGYEVVRIHDLEPVADRIAELYYNVHAKAAVKPVTIPPEYLPALAKAAGPERFRCHILRKGDEIAGFITSLKSGTTAVGYYIGIDYSVNEQLPVYFRLLQQTVADAIEMKCKRLSLGRTALEPKAKLGAKPAPTRVWLRHRLPLMNLIVRPLLGVVPHDEAPERNVMKGT
jgi:hypothetical protein